MPDWGTTTARVLCHLRIVTLTALQKATEQQKAAINRVWEFVEVDRNEYNKDMSGQWRSVKGKDRRNRVREQLRTRFSEEAFLDNPSGKAARKKFTRADLLAWGEQLLNPADAAANAVSDANAATSAEGVQGDPRAEADVQKPEGGEAADAAANVAAGAAVADRVAVETTNAAVADAAAAFSPAPRERGPPAGEPTASEGVDGELPLCLNDVSSQTANSYNQIRIKTHGHVVYDFRGKRRTINLQDLTNFDCMKEKTRPEVKGICASVYFLQDLLTIYPRGPHGRRDPLSMISSPDYERILKQINERTVDNIAIIEDETSSGTIGAVDMDLAPARQADLFSLEELKADQPLSPADAAANAPAGAAVADRVAVVAASNSGTAVEPDDAMECDSREVSTDGRGAGPPPGAPSISSVNAAAVAFNPTPQESDTSASGLAAAGSFASVGATPEAGTGGDVADPVTDGSLAGSSVEVSPARSQDSEDEDEEEEDGGALGELGELERALAFYELAYGPDSKEVAATLTDLGAVYCDLGDYAKARDVLKRALAIEEQAYGPDSKEVAITLTDLGAVYCDLGDYAKARDVLEPALAIRKRAYGPEHPEVAISLNNLGAVYCRLGDYAKVRDVLEPALAIRKREYGPEHPEVAITLDTLGYTYNELGDYAKTRDVLEPALPIMERAYGSKSKEVARTLNNLGAAYSELGDYAKTRDVLEPALPIMMRAYGSESKEVAVTLTCLGIAYNGLGDYAKLRGVLERALPIVARTYGNESPEVADTLHDLGIAYEKLGDHTKQRDALVRALPIMERTLGIDHAIVDITRKEVVELEKEHGLGHSNVCSALENAANADPIGTWTCSGSVENVSKISWKSRSRDCSSRGGDRRSDLPSDRANLDQVDMELDSELLLNQAMSLVSF